MFKKYLLPLLNAVAMPVPYPTAAGVHAIVGASLIWWAHGAPRDGVTPLQVLLWLGLPVLGGLALVGLVQWLNKRAGYGPNLR
jgi:hypothetical protein